MSAPKYSLLIPTYNRQGLIAETLDSAFAQDYPNLEVIVVDNCSTDDTWARLQEYRLRRPELRIFRNPENVGPVLNWRACLEQATGEYGKFLYSDDLLSPEFVRETLSRFDSDTAFVLGSIVVFGGAEGESLPQDFPAEIAAPDYLRDALLFGRHRFPVSPSAATFRVADMRRNLLTEIPNPAGLDFRRFGAGNDLLLFLLACRGRRWVRSSRAARAYFRLHPGSLTVANRLEAYYHFAREHFVDAYQPELKDDWETACRLQAWRGRLRFLEDRRRYRIRSWRFLVEKARLAVRPARPA